MATMNNVQFIKDLEGCKSEIDILRLIREHRAFWELVRKKTKRSHRSIPMFQCVTQSYSTWLNVLHVFEDILKNNLMIHRNAPRSQKELYMITELVDIVRNKEFENA